uniref:GATA-type domain-containing protein n=1 Tax=Meloidogyne hapla TaxID=6305 RepID=A0A1I8BFA9_MELHA
NNYFETSILENNIENIKIGKFKTSNEERKDELKDKIEFYKEKLLSYYWDEINLIGYKIELLNRHKEIGINVESLIELKERIVLIGNQISGLLEKRKRHCFICKATKTKHWYNYLDGNYLCSACYHYYHKRHIGKIKPKTNKLVCNF